MFLYDSKNKFLLSVCFGSAIIDFYLIDYVKLFHIKSKLKVK